ncbi:MAG: AAA family ATPase [Treponema sp.]|jgi:flagellar biosynthesis protein FlhG|nr:AAA family ATPase [Treponema sp.]
MRIIPIASGKGGVGKSLVSANLGVAFAQAGKKVVVADLDLGASNLHLVLGHHSPKKGIGTFLSHARSDFADVIADTDIKNLRFIPGDTEIPGLANLKLTQRKTLVKRLIALQDNTDILIIDLGAGTHQSILDFFLLSGQGIIVSAPAVTAVLNAYVFLKNAVFRLMFTSFAPDSKARAYLEKLRKDNNHQQLYVPKLLPEIQRVDKTSYKNFSAKLEKLRPRLIMNMINEPKEADVAMKIRRSCEEYLALKIEHLGIMYRDALQDVALASRLPIIQYKPQSILSQGLYRIAEKILESEEDSALPDEQQIDESFQEAEIEAETDFENKIDYIGDLLHSGALSHGDLIETVKSQQLEISKLKKENNFMKLNITKALHQGYKI